MTCEIRIGSVFVIAVSPSDTVGRLLNEAPITRQLCFRDSGALKSTVALKICGANCTWHTWICPLCEILPVAGSQVAPGLRICPREKRCQGGSAQRERDAGMHFQAVTCLALALACCMRRRSLCPVRSLMVGRTSRCSHVSGDAGEFRLIAHAAISANRLKYLHNVCTQPEAADVRLAAVVKAPPCD